MVHQRAPFTSLEEQLLWYDALPYLGLNRAVGRRLLADRTTAALSDADPAVPCGLARADALAAVDHSLEFLAEITSVYEAGVKTFEKK